MRSIILAVSQILVLCGFQCGGDKLPTVTKGESNLGVVRFPEGWIATDDDGTRFSVYMGQGLMVRKSPGKSQDELLFAMKGLNAPPRRGTLHIDSENRYAVSLDGRFAVRPVTEDEWNKAELVSISREEIRSNAGKLPSEPKAHNDESVFYRGKTFAKSGSFWANGVALASPSGKWLAVLSYSSDEKPPKSEFLFFGNSSEPGKGEVFWDVYDTLTGEKVMAGHAPYQGLTPSLLFSETLWADDQYLIMPVTYRTQTCFLGILPKQ